MSVLGIAPTVIRALMRHGDEPVAAHDLFRCACSDRRGSRGTPTRGCGISRRSVPAGCGDQLLRRHRDLRRHPRRQHAHALTAVAFAGPCPGMAADVVDEDGQAARQSCELVIRAPWPGIIRGFWRDRERYLRRTGRAGPTSGCTATGLRLTGRTLVCPGTERRHDQGRGQAPRTPGGQSALVAHRAVAEAAAIGVPDPVKGEALVVFVVLKPGFTNSPELRGALGAAWPRISARRSRLTPSRSCRSCPKLAMPRYFAAWSARSTWGPIQAISRRSRTTAPSPQSD